jgi:hypothetical protein
LLLLFLLLLLLFLISGNLLWGKTMYRADTLLPESTTHALHVTQNQYSTSITWNRLLRPWFQFLSVKCSII